MNTTTLNKQNSNIAGTFAQACVASCQKIINQIAQVKQHLANEFGGLFKSHERLLEQAINEADALAHETAYPHLLFPLLAVEKVQAAANWQARQQFLLRQFPDYALAA